MSSSADREPSQDANPYQSPTCSGWGDDPVAFLQQLPGGAIEVRGSLQPRDVFLAHFNTSLGFTGFTIIQMVLIALALYMGLGTVLFVSCVIALSDMSLLALLFPAGLCTGWLLLLIVIARQWMSAKYLKRLWDHRRGIFAEQTRRVTAQAIVSISADEQTDTLWTDYAYYRLSKHRLRLHLSQTTQQRRRLHRPEGGILWKAGTRWYDGIDVFPREQFASRDEWQLFVRVVKKKLHRR